MPTASRFIQKDWSIQAQYDERTRRAACHIVDQAQKLSNPGSAEYIALQGIEGIDPGEALLVAATANEPDAYILTADKRCLKALARSAPPAILQRLAHRIICLEQLILCLLQQFSDFDKLARRIRKAVPCEFSITEAFKLTEPTEIAQSLQAEIDRLRADTGTLLVL